MQLRPPAASLCSLWPPRHCSLGAGPAWRPAAGSHAALYAPDARRRRQQAVRPPAAVCDGRAADPQRLQSGGDPVCKDRQHQ